MSQLQLKKITMDIIDHAEQAMVPEHGLGKVVDDYFIQQLKQDEMEHAQVDSRLYEALRSIAKAEVLPLYALYRADTARVRARRQNRKLWQYVLGMVVVIELLETILTRGRSLAPQVFIPMAIFDCFVGFIIFTAAQYLDDRHLARARKRLEKTVEGLDRKIKTDVEYDHRRELLDTDILRGEALEIIAHYAKAEDFWRDYAKVREADPTLPAVLKSLNIPAFERFLKFHVEGVHSPVARQQRFNRLFIEAQEVFISRDRENYVLNHLKTRVP